MAGSNSNAIQGKTDFQVLDEVLGTGDLAAAFRTFAKLQQAVLDAWVTSGQPADIEHPVIRDFDAIADGLNANDLTATRTAFAQLKQDIDAIERARLEREAA